jgi:hypothetical protein
MLRLQHGRALKFSKAFSGQFDQMPGRWWRVCRLQLVFNVDVSNRLDRIDSLWQI